MLKNAAISAHLVKKMHNAPFLLRQFLCLLGGLLTALALPPLAFVPLGFIGLALFYILLGTFRPRSALLAGWLFGFGYFAIGLYWIGNALLVSGNEYKWAWPLAVAGLPAALSFFPAIAFGLVRRLGDLSKASGFVLFIAVGGLFEYLRGVLFTGFPWNLYGSIWAHNLPVLQSLSVFGIYGLSLLTLFWTGALGYTILLLANGKSAAARNVFLLAAVTLGLTYGLGAYRLHGEPQQAGNKANDSNVVFRLVQPNIAQEDKWDPAKTLQNIDKLTSLSLAQPANNGKTTVIVWPETAINFRTLRQYDTRLALRKMLESYAGSPVFLATGYLDAEEGANGKPVYYNSLRLMDRSLRTLGQYNKSHLVPFGEYIPFQKYIPLTPVVQFTGFHTGDGPVTLHSNAAHAVPPFSPLICYEIIFPGHVVAHNKPEEGTPRLIINVTNDSWYGDSAGPYQHLMQARFRAIEQGLPVLRSANTGISALISPYGDILHAIPLGRAGAENLILPAPLTTPTIFSYWQNNSFLLLLALSFFAVFILKQRAT